MDGCYFYISEDQYKSAERNGICKSTLKGRIERGWDMETAITKPPGNNRKPRWCRKLRTIAQENGVCNSSLVYRTQVMGMSPYKAATHPKDKNKKAPDYETEEVLKTCKKNGISKTTFRARVRVLGWSVARAMTEPVKEYDFTT